ncbi:A24 family peptidase [Viridibacterium curvum]|uniref:Prepilin leader peptidase/N-methyltransferase n=1 Tax=Viridibacterium curvum TaxID=1101404 RepID=A0ABP9Q7M8_9RHOO
MLDFLQDPIALALLAAVLGLTVGSFLNVVIHRLPRMMEKGWLPDAVGLLAEKLPEALSKSLQDWWQTESAKEPRYNLAVPRSACPHCGHKIGALENIPVISYLVLRGRCRGCKAPISKRYPLVELLTGALSALVAWHFGYSLACAGALLYVWSMIVLTFIDLDTMLLPDDITLPLMWLGLLLNLSATFVPLKEALIGAVAGYLILWSVFWAFKLTTGKEGMGYGDFKLLAAIGAWLGWQVLPAVILLSSLVGAVVGISMIVFAKHGREMPIPFGPYLAAAGVISLFSGDTLTRLIFGA